MEPFRPWVDAVIQKEALRNAKLYERFKKRIQIPNESVLYNGKKMPLMVSVHHLVLKYS